MENENGKNDNGIKEIELIQYLQYEPWDMTYDELRTEIMCQKSLHSLFYAQVRNLKISCNQIKRNIKKRIKEGIDEWNPEGEHRYNQSLAVMQRRLHENEIKVEFFEKLLMHNEALLDKLNYYCDGRYRNNTSITRKQRRCAEHRVNRARATRRKDQKIEKQEARLQCVSQWDKDKFLLVARDRGYMTVDSVVHLMAENLDQTFAAADRMLNTGRMSWGQVMILGALFEMTPKEFCDIFMSGYFEEVNDGEFRAVADNIDQLIVPLPELRSKRKKSRPKPPPPPKKPKPEKPDPGMPTVIVCDSEGNPIAEDDKWL